MTGRGRRGLQLSALATSLVAVAAAACIDLSVDPTTIGSIEFVAPTNPSIVLHDTLRDSTGAPARLQARVFDTGGDELTDAEVVFVNSDSLVRVVEGGLVVSVGDSLATGTARLFASFGGLQSSPRTLAIIRRPDSISASVAEDTVLYSPPTTGTSIDTSTTVGVVVRSGPSAVGSVRVTFELWRGATRLTVSDTSTYALVSTLGRVSTVDTTDGSGLAQRTFRLRMSAGQSVQDTIVVRASTSLGGAPLKGAPAMTTLVILPAP